MTSITESAAARTRRAIINAEAAAADPGLVREIGEPLSAWAGRCHEMSLKVLRTGRFGPGRIARGFASGVPGQHSWIVLGGDVWDTAAVLVDPTIFASPRACAGRIEVRANALSSHVPHFTGSIWKYAPPPHAAGEVIALAVPVSADAAHFLDLCGPLDTRGWHHLAHAPARGWPSGEIVAAMADTPALKALVPVDYLGMATDRNPKGLYR